MAPRHKHKAIAERHDDFLSESDLSSDDSQLSPAEGRYRDNTRSASAVALPPSRQGSYKDEDESSASDVDEKKVGRHSALPGRGDSFDLGSSDGDSDEEQLVGTGKKSRKAVKGVASKKKKQKRSWLMRSVAADGTTTQPVSFLPPPSDSLLSTDRTSAVRTFWLTLLTPYSRLKARAPRAPSSS